MRASLRGTGPIMFYAACIGGGAVVGACGALALIAWRYR